MKIIHCADLHLDSKMTSNLDRVKAKERRSELLNTFTRMVDYAAEHGVSAILIAGDMFDTGSISALTRNTVRDKIFGNPGIDFYYLKGNHDRDSFLSSLEEMPDNLKLFGDEWRSYPLNDDSSVILTGIELSPDNSTVCHDSLVLDPDAVNIVMLHGQETESRVSSGSKDRAELISVREFKNRNIDYLALGHIHYYKEERLDGRGVYCYPGCLEGRGFDETGEHGFVLLDIDTASHSIERTFIPFATRRLYEVPVDITDLNTTGDIIDKVTVTLAGEDIDSGSLLKIVLKGDVDIEIEKDTDHIYKNFEDRFYFVKVSDETGYKVDYTDYALDASLKGEYVRMIEAAEDISEADKPEVIRMGIMAIANEVV